jgi:phage N-6-adenine-methyltransferase
MGGIGMSGLENIIEIVDGVVADIKESRQEWQTPDPLYNLLDGEFGFHVDVAADTFNSKAEFHLCEERDALRVPWFRIEEEFWGHMATAFCNPPYKNPLQWIERAHDQTRLPGTTAVLLLNHDPSTKWYARAIETASEIRILTKKRVQFLAPDGIKASSNSKPQCVIVFRRKLDSAPCHVWHWDWTADLWGGDK